VTSPITVFGGAGSAGPSEGPEKLPRASFLARLRRVGTIVVGGIAVTWIDAPSAFAAPYCCSLAYPNGPWCGGRPGLNFQSCPSGYHKQEWSCCWGTHLFYCEECTQSRTTCWNGPWKCSNYYTANVC
jgi:hypothetical protein